MPLSEHEQQLLDQIERALYAEDPKFASNVRSARLHRPSRHRRLEGAAVFVVGLALLIVGMLIPVRVLSVPVVSVAGFVLMFIGALLVLTAVRKGNPGKDGSGGSSGPGAARGRPKSRRSALTVRMEERLRKRFDQG